MKKPIVQNPEATARKLRQRLGVDDLTWIDPMTVLVKLKRLIRGFEFALVSSSELDGKLARWESDRKRIAIRHDVFYAANEQRQEGRARYSIFHEVVHALEGHSGTLYRAVSREDIPVYARKLRALEAYTDSVTAAFMAPRHLIVADETPQSIAFRFGMSEQAARIRHEEVFGRPEMRRVVPQDIRDLLSWRDKI